MVAGARTRALFLLFNIYIYIYFILTLTLFIFIPLSSLLEACCQALFLLPPGGDSNYIPEPIELNLGRA